MLFRKILLASLLSGLIAGGLLGVLQLYITTPIIVAAEAYEHLDDSGEHGDESWSPYNDLQRSLYSILATTIIAWAYALILQSAMNLSGQANRRNGLLWGLAGYLVFFVVPAIGLPPEIPAMQSAPIDTRQTWWMSTSATTAAALVMLVFAKGWIKIAAIPLLFSPFMFAAPYSNTSIHSSNDAEVAAAIATLQQEFIIATAVTLALFWVVLGYLSGFFHERLLSRQSEPLPGDLNNADD